MRPLPSMTSASSLVRASLVWNVPASIALSSTMLFDKRLLPEEITEAERAGVPASPSLRPTYNEGTKQNIRILREHPTQYRCSFHLPSENLGIPCWLSSQRSVRHCRCTQSPLKGPNKTFHQQELHSLYYLESWAWFGIPFFYNL